MTKPTNGDATVGGYSITTQPEKVKRMIRVSPQETAVAPNLSIKDNLELIRKIHGFSRKNTEQLNKILKEKQQCEEKTRNEYIRKGDA